MNHEEANYIAIHLTEIRIVLGTLVSAIVAMAGGYIYFFHYISKLSKSFNATILEQSAQVITVTKDNTNAMDKLVTSVEHNTKTLENLPDQFLLMVKSVMPR